MDPDHYGAYSHENKTSLKEKPPPFTFERQKAMAIKSVKTPYFKNFDGDLRFGLLRFLYCGDLRFPYISYKKSYALSYKILKIWGW